MPLSRGPLSAERLAHPDRREGLPNDHALAPESQFAPHNRRVETISPPAFSSVRFT